MSNNNSWDPYLFSIMIIVWNYEFRTGELANQLIRNHLKLRTKGTLMFANKVNYEKLS